MDWSSDPTALERGWPIATRVIEGACRHLVKDRMDITGARRELDGAEAVLKLRTLISNGEFAEYRRYHLNANASRSRCPLCQRHDPEDGLMCL